MVTASGRAFYPLDPRPDEVTIEDIAHALSLLCRFGGHVRHFYSVAQHSVLVSQHVAATLRSGAGLWTPETATLALWGLLHDAAEAYCGDVIWPLKQARALKAAFAPIEAGIMAAICDRFDIPREEPEIVKACDLRALATEKRDVTVRAPADVANTALDAAAAKARTGAWHCDHVEPFNQQIESWTPEEAEESFLRRLHDLQRVRHA
jgi:5'-deoxynucleotidase YfbR-like HD superfamily hydrolase